MPSYSVWSLQYASQLVNIFTCSTVTHCLRQTADRCLCKIEEAEVEINTVRAAPKIICARKKNLLFIESDLKIKDVIRKADMSCTYAELKINFVPGHVQLLQVNRKRKGSYGS